MITPKNLHRRRSAAIVPTIALGAAVCLAGAGTFAEDAVSLGGSCARAEGTAPLTPWRSLTGGLGVPDPFANPAAPPTRARQRIRLIAPIAVTARGNDVFVLDMTQSAILHFDSGLGTASVFAALPSVPLGTSIYLDRDLSLYVLDPIAAEVLRYDRTGVLIQRLQNTEALANPVAIVAGTGSAKLMIADALRPYIVGLDELGAVASTIGAKPAKPLPIQRIDDMAAGLDGLYVLDKLAHQIHALSPGGGYRVAFGEKDLSMPAAVAADGYGRVYVADNFDSTIKVFEGGQLVGSAGGPGAAPGRFKQIFDLWVDGELLYVADAPGARIEIMHIEPPCH